MLRIVTFITGLYCGGAEIAHIRLVAGTKKECEHTVIALRSGGALGAACEAAGARVVQITDWRTILTLKADVVLGQMYYGCAAAALFKAILRPTRPLFWVIHNSLPDIRSESRSTRFSIALCSFLSWLPSKIIYVAKRSARDHEGTWFPSSKTLVIPNPCDTKLFRRDIEMGNQLRSSLGFSDKDFVFGLIGRVQPRKDHQTMLQALELARAENQHIKALICGAGTETLRVPLSLKANISLLGERSDISSVMNACDAGVLSSVNEALPNVLAEFMACERICVSTDVGDAAEMVTALGLTVPPRDPKSLAGALVAIAKLSREELRARGLAARASVEQRFSPELVMGKFRSLWFGINDIAGLS